MCVVIELCENDWLTPTIDQAKSIEINSLQHKKTLSTRRLLSNFILFNNSTAKSMVLQQRIQIEPRLRKTFWLQIEFKWRQSHVNNQPTSHSRVDFVFLLFQFGFFFHILAARNYSLLLLFFRRRWCVFSIQTKQIANFQFSMIENM